MSTRLSDTSYAVLGLLDRSGPATAYQLKHAAQRSLFHFWAIPHTQIYSECARLARAGLVEEHREDTGRRRRTYRLSPSGRAAYERWRDDPDTGPRELRDPALLKLFCGADPAPLARTQLPRHEDRLQRYLALQDTDIPTAARLALEAGIAQEREHVRFWTRLTQAPVASQANFATDTSS
jgi:DNA-binding PadR family transcriptional regulator